MKNSTYSVPPVATNVDLPTAHTVAFILDSLGPVPRRVLEVGCGRGEVAAGLRVAGHTVVGIDSDAAAVAAARGAGVDARHVAWLELDDDSTYDAVIFSRSLHHLRPLDDTLDLAARQLRATGLVLVEDFAFSEVNATTIEWFYRLLQTIEGNEWIDATVADDGFAGQMLRCGAGAWHAAHTDALHTAGEMRAALEQRFALDRAVEAPYLYRYTVALFGNGRAAAEHIRWAFDEEARAAHAGKTQLIGRRFVCGAPR